MDVNVVVSTVSVQSVRPCARVVHGNAKATIATIGIRNL